MNHLKFSLSHVFRNPGYVILSLLSFILIVFLSAAVGNFHLLWYALMNEPGRFLSLMISTLQSLGTNFTPLSAVSTVIVAVLFGINISMFIYTIRNKKTIKGAKTAGGGLLAGAFGVGCASCGAFLLSGLLSSAGAAGLLVILPLHGTEFSLISIILLGWSTWSISKSLTTSCKIK